MLVLLLLLRFSALWMDFKLRAQFVGVEAAHLEACRSPAGSQRPRVHETIPTILNKEVQAPQSTTDVIFSLLEFKKIHKQDVQNLYFSFY